MKIRFFRAIALIFVLALVVSLLRPDVSVFKRGIARPA
jgi:hypothetical protein